MDCFVKIHEPQTPYEREVAQRWWALPRNSNIPLSQGGQCQVLFAGRPGGAVGPDVQDAVIRFLPAQQALVGAVEFHVYASDWRVHQHQSDPRYNVVLLHVVLVCDDPMPTRSQNGQVIPTCSLADMVSSCLDSSLPIGSLEVACWPCQQLWPLHSRAEQHKLLLQAGLQRFEDKSHRFLETLHQSIPEVDGVDFYDACLFPALAEALGYGRDQMLFRALGMQLLWKSGTIPEPLGKNMYPALLDRGRLNVLTNLLAHWRIPGIWRTLRHVLLSDGNALSDGQLLARMRARFGALGLSLARTDILMCNVVFPFATAVALLEQHEGLGERAKALYLLHPGLPSNRITRMMCAQLQLPKEPLGSCRQQGLQYIYHQTCREKRCDVCMMGKNNL